MTINSRLFVFAGLAACLLTPPGFAQIQPDWPAVKAEIEWIRAQHNLPSIGFAVVVEDGYK